LASLACFTLSAYLAWNQIPSIRQSMQPTVTLASSEAIESKQGACFLTVPTANGQFFSPRVVDGSLLGIAVTKGTKIAPKTVRLVASIPSDGVVASEASERVNGYFYPESSLSEAKRLALKEMFPGQSVVGVVEISQEGPVTFDRLMVHFIPVGVVGLIGLILAAYSMPGALSPRATEIKPLASEDHAALLERFRKLNLMTQGKTSFVGQDESGKVLVSNEAASEFVEMTANLAVQRGVGCLAPIWDILVMKEGQPLVVSSAIAQVYLADAVDIVRKAFGSDSATICAYLWWRHLFPSENTIAPNSLLTRLLDTPYQERVVVAASSCARTTGISDQRLVGLIYDLCDLGRAEYSEVVKISLGLVARS
jgi:hypothetical protein